MFISLRRFLHPFDSGGEHPLRRAATLAPFLKLLVAVTANEVEQVPRNFLGVTSGPKQMFHRPLGRRVFI
jgi:hypothetical protein